MVCLRGLNLSFLRTARFYNELFKFAYILFMAFSERSILQKSFRIRIVGYKPLTPKFVYKDKFPVKVLDIDRRWRVIKKRAKQIFTRGQFILFVINPLNQRNCVINKSIS